MSFQQHGSVTFHAAVIVCSEQDDEHGHMAEAGPVVLERVVEGQVDDVVHDEHDGDGQDEKCAFLVVVLEGRVHAQAYPHYDRQQHVNPARPGVLELLLELPIV